MQSEYKYQPKIEFDPQPFIEVAKQLVRSEDTNLALKFLKGMLPSYYRDNPPQEIRSLYKQISQAKCTITDYVNNEKDDIKSIDFCKHAVESVLRFAVIKKTIEEDNKKDIVPHIIDMGPGDFCLPIGLNSFNIKFTYNAIGLYEKAKIDAKKLLEHLWVEREVKDRPTYFLAYEIIEHLDNEYEIRQQYDRLFEPEKIFLSTPLYTYSVGNVDWEKTKQLPHLRTYTPKEFMNVCLDMFPEYTFQYVALDVQTMIGTKIK